MVEKNHVLTATVGEVGESNVISNAYIFVIYSLCNVFCSDRTVITPTLQRDTSPKKRKINKG